MLPGYERVLRPNPAPATGTASRIVLRLLLGSRELIVRHTVIEPGGSSGRHYHDGPLFVLVARGTLDHPYADGAPVRYRRGRIFREPSGPENRHVARNTGTEPVTLFVLYLNPKGSPLSHSVAGTDDHR
ncbi:cupin domain-containing protein [Nocardia shimofusensis]|uniref:cupin domain-containing protein n=1 Tax=Nocardia shimofusensis TaxID=228596 RepID=UPI00082E8F11|nr:cupin domain-containing protein [Nocardia shimofusensis]